MANQSKNWYEIATKIYEIHVRKSAENPGWTLDDTRRLTGYSKGYISESIQLYRAALSDPKLVKCENREVALGKIRPEKEIFPNGMRVAVRIGHTFESGIIIGRGTIMPRENVWIVKLDHPFFFERASRRMDTIIAKTSDIKELE